MTFRITDQARVNLTINERELLNEFEDLLDLTIMESAGTELPILNLNFTTYDSGVLQLINEGNEINVSIGSDEDTMESASFIMQNPAVQHEGSHRWLVASDCLKSNIKAWSSPSVNISKPMGGVNRIVDVARNTLRDFAAEDSNVTESADRQRWIQYGCPLKQHVDEVWMHTDLGPNSFPLLSYTIDGLRVRDSRLLFASEPAWEFVALTTDGEPLKANQILYSGQLGVTQMSGFLNSVGGRGQLQPWYVLASGASQEHESSPVSNMATTSAINASMDFGKPTNRRQALTRNTHPTYWEAYNRNRTQLALYSSVRVIVVWSGFYRNVRPLDLVTLRDLDVRKEVDESVLAYTGRYIVSKVTNNVSNRRFTATAELVRESFNQNIGQSLVTA